MTPFPYLKLPILAVALLIHLSQCQAFMAHKLLFCCDIAASMDVTLHIPCFVRSEQRQHTLRFLQFLYYGFLPSSFIFAEFLHLHRAQAMKLDAMLIGSYLTSLRLSMLV